MPSHLESGAGRASTGAHLTGADAGRDRWAGRGVRVHQWNERLLPAVEFSVAQESGEKAHRTEPRFGANPLYDNCTGRLCVYTRRMPRMQVYLPDELYKVVKARRLPASELLQEAVRAEVRRQELLAKTDEYLAELVNEVGEPGARQRARAGALAQRIANRKRRKVG